MNTECILITINTPEVRSALRDYPGIELVNSQSTYIAWHWVDPREEDLVAAEAIEGYKGTVQIA